jgi:hypothetical protein
MEDSESLVAGFVASVNEAKEAGNDALKAANMPLARECYEKALQRADDAIASLKRPSELQTHDLVKYEFGFAAIDIVEGRFADYILKDLGNDEQVKVKAGRYEEVIKRYKAEDIQRVPYQLFEARLAVCQNIALAALKDARGSKRDQDFEEAIKKANDALSMDGRSFKALMRKGNALLELKEIHAASKVLTQAAKEAKFRDPELVKLLQRVSYEQRKAKASGKQKSNLPHTFQDYEDYAQKTGAIADGGTKQFQRVDSDDESEGTNDSEREMLSGRWPKGCQRMEEDVDEDETLAQAFGCDLNCQSRENAEADNDSETAEDSSYNAHAACSSSLSPHKQTELKEAEPVDEDLADLPPLEEVTQPDVQLPSQREASETPPLRKENHVGRIARQRWPHMVRMIVIVIMGLMIVGGSAALWMRGPPNHSVGQRQYSLEPDEEVEL